MLRNLLTLLAVCSLTLTLAACGGKPTPNELDKYSTSEFGQKRAESYAKETGLGTIREVGKGDESNLLFGGEEGVLGSLGGGGGGRGRTKEDIRRGMLFDGALSVVMDLPVVVADRDGGFLSTDWKVNPQNDHERYRLNIHVTGKDPYGDVKVVVLRQSSVRGNWEDRPSDPDLAAQIAKAIRKQAQQER